MARFAYIARDRTGKRLAGVLDSANQDEVAALLRGKGLIIVSIEPKSSKYEASIKPQGVKLSYKYRHVGINANDLSLFCRQLSTLLGAGVTILEALVIISKQVSSRKFHNVLCDLRKRMEDGLSLHEAMAKESTVFSQLWVNLVESGEASGNLAIVLSRLASYLERNAQFRNKIVSALIYPIILLTIGIGALLFLTIKIIPVFSNLFSSFDMQLPFVTQLLINTSNFMRKYLLPLVLVIAGIVIFIKRYIKQPQGRRNFETFLFKLPVFGEFFRNLVIERFASEMTTLIESGVPILYALEISERSVDNLVMADIIRTIKEEVRQGHSLSAPMAKIGFFEPMIVQMVSIGEEVGDLSGMFKRIHAFYEEAVETLLTRFTVMFEPIMLVFIGLIIGVMVVGMFLPIFQISKLGM